MTSPPFGEIGLITSIDPGFRSDLVNVSIWIKNQQEQLISRISNVVNYKVGNWVTIVGRENRFLKAKQPDIVASCEVSEKGKTIRLTTPVTFPKNGTCPSSELLGWTPVLSNCDTPPWGTYLSYVLFIPREKQDLRDRYMSQWVFSGLAESVARPIAVEEQVYALVLHVNRNSNSEFKASLWMKKGSACGSILVVTSSSDGDKSQLRKGKWLQCVYRECSFPSIAFVGYEVISFRPCCGDEDLPVVLPTRSESDALLRVQTQVKIRSLVGAEELGFSILPKSTRGLGDVAVSVADWYDNLGFYYGYEGSVITATFAFARQDLGLNAFWYMLSVEGYQQPHYSAVDLNQQFQDYNPYEFLDLQCIGKTHGPTSDDGSSSHSTTVEPTPANRHLNECRSYQDLENFVQEMRSDLDCLIVDFENVQHAQKGKVVSLFTTVDGLAVCFSPTNGWCVAKYVGRSNISSFTRMFAPGNWILVNLVPSKADEYCRVADWVACPDYKPCAPPFGLFCEHRESELIVAEALAFNNVKQRIDDDDGRRYVVMDTPIGDVWLPGTVECPPASPMHETYERVQCPAHCRCGRAAYQEYEKPYQKYGDQPIANVVEARREQETSEFEGRERETSESGERETSESDGRERETSESESSGVDVQVQLNSESSDDGTSWLRWRDSLRASCENRCAFRKDQREPKPEKEKAKATVIPVPRQPEPLEEVQPIPEVIKVEVVVNSAEPQLGGEDDEESDCGDESDSDEEILSDEDEIHGNEPPEVSNAFGLLLSGE